MAAGGKGHAPRPFSVSADEYADNWSRIFGKNQSGHGREVEAAGSNPANVGSIPTAPANCDGCKEAIYIDNETGAQVTEAWWPGDPLGYPHNA